MLRSLSPFNGKKGDILSREQVIAISGYSGVDGFLTFPWAIPHVHFNVWHNSFHTDPFTYKSNSSLWKNTPLSYTWDSNDEKTLVTDFVSSEYNESAVNTVIEHCLTPKVKEYLSKIKCPNERAAHTIIEMNYYPTRSPHKQNLYSDKFERTPTLDIPFPKDNFDGIKFLDDYLESKKKKEFFQLHK